MWLHLNSKERMLSAFAVLILVVTAGAIGLKYNNRAAPAEATPTKPFVGTSSSKPMPAEVVVYVTGEVISAGTQHLPFNSRVEDAIKAAGGFSTNANRAGVNLARKLVDGEQIIVPKLNAPSTSTESAAPQQSTPAKSDEPVVLNLNTATEEELEALPGIGKVMATQIVQFRQQHGDFTSVDQLMAIPRFGQKTLEKLRPYLKVEGAS